MTKIQLPFPLSAPLDEKQMKCISDLYGKYGILRINIDQAGPSLLVEYDATRFGTRDVEAALAGAGLPLAQRAV